MNQAALGIYADMRLHVEVPLVAFLGLRHLGITLLVFVLGRTGGCNQGGINHHAPLHLQPLLRKNGADFGKDRYRQIVFLQQMAEAKNGALVRHHVFESVQSGKPAQQHSSCMPTRRPSRRCRNREISQHATTRICLKSSKMALLELRGSLISVKLITKDIPLFEVTLAPPKRRKQTFFYDFTS